MPQNILGRKHGLNMMLLLFTILMDTLMLCLASPLPMNNFDNVDARGKTTSSSSSNPYFEAAAPAFEYRNQDVHLNQQPWLSQAHTMSPYWPLGTGLDYAQRNHAPQTSAQSYIGPFPEWTPSASNSQSPNSRETMLLNPSNVPFDQFSERVPAAVPPHVSSLSTANDHSALFDRLGIPALQTQNHPIRSPTFNNLEPLDKSGFETDHSQGDSAPPQPQVVETGDQTSLRNPKDAETPEFLRPEIDISNSPLKMLRNHPDFMEWSRQYKTNSFPMVIEISPEAQKLKVLINSRLFNDKLVWGTKGDDAMVAKLPGHPLRRFIYRAQNRASFMTVRSLMEVGPHQNSGRIFAVPHRYYKEGSAMFDPDPDPTFRRIQFSFWSPSHDGLRPRLQFVGAASLKPHDAIRILRQGSLHHEEGESASENSDTKWWLSRVASSRSQAQYTVSYDWLEDFAAVKKVDSIDVRGKSTTSASLVSRLHPDSEWIKTVSNQVLFGGHVLWQNKPSEIILGARTPRSDDTIRYHKNSHLVYMTKPETTELLRYRMVLIPYRVLGARARLFEPSLSGMSRAFTLWASRSVPGGSDSHTFDFVAGGSLSLPKTASVLRHAESTMERLKGTVPPIH